MKAHQFFVYLLLIGSACVEAESSEDKDIVEDGTSTDGEEDGLPDLPDNPSTDADGDGFDSAEDCNDSDPTIFPGSVTEATGAQCMIDADGDGYGDAFAAAPYDAGSDCDDTDGNTHPGAASSEADATACMTDADGDGYGDSTPAAGVTPGSDAWDDDPNRWFEPLAGHWTYGEATITSNSCSDDTGSNQNTDQVGFTLSDIANNQFMMMPDGTNEQLSCTFNNADYNCPVITANETIDINNVDIELGVNTTITGTFTDSRSLSATFQLDFVCLDVDDFFWNCGMLSDYLPCSLTFTIPASLD